jgi:hypothetical protein
MAYALQVAALARVNAAFTLPSLKLCNPDPEAGCHRSLVGGVPTLLRRLRRYLLLVGLIDFFVAPLETSRKTTHYKSRNRTFPSTRSTPV